MKFKTKLILWLIFILFLVIAIPIISSKIFQRDKCALAFQQGYGECCYGISGCQNCFYVNPVPIANKSICNVNETCNTNPMIEQHNALVNTITCECNHFNYNQTNKKLKNDIERLYKIMTNEDKEAKDICSSGIMTMVKYNY